MRLLPTGGCLLGIKDLAGLEKPLTKLVETLSGYALEPSLIVRRAKAEAEATVIKVQGDIAAAELAARAGHRVEGRELRRQANIEAIVTEAARQLPESVDACPVEPDWTAEFINCAQDVSDETMRSLWGRILAGEVVEPGSFSRRTLAPARLMSKQEAGLFTRFCSFVWWIDNEAVCVRDPNAEEMFRAANIHFGSLMMLRVIGLITDEGGPVEMTTHIEPGRDHEFEYFDTRLKVRIGTSDGDVILVTAPLTLVGMELAAIAGAVRHDEYFDRCLVYYRESGLELEIMPPSL